MSDQTYLKVTVDSMQLFNHLSFNSGNKKVDNVEIILYVEYIGQESGKEVVKSLQEICMVNTRSRQAQDFIFEPLTNRWDCLCFKSPLNNVKGQIKIQYQIRKTFQNSFERRKTMIDQKSKSESNQKQQELVQINSKNKRDQIALPYKSNSISFPLQKILKQPYVMNELTIDLYVKKQSQQLSKIKPQSENNNSNKQSNERDGVINVNIVYLPNIRPDIKVKNVSIKTKAFVKSLALVVKQIAKKQQTTKINDKIDQEQQKLRKQILSQAVIPLEVGDWQHFQNKLSFQNPISIPLVLNNNLDQFDFSLTYQMKVKSLEEQNDQRQAKQKQINKKNKNSKTVETNKSSQKEEKSQKQKEQSLFPFSQTTRRYERTLKRIPVQKLSKQKSISQQWTKQSYKYQNAQQQFQLQFLFNLSLNLSIQRKSQQKQQQNEYIKEQNYIKEQIDQNMEQFNSLKLDSQIYK